jgi:fructose-specific phosphotransferase system IIC component
MTDQPKPPGPSLRKRVLLTLYLMLPFLVLATLMYVLAFQLQKQGASLGDRPAQSTSK